MAKRERLAKIDRVVQGEVDQNDNYGARPSAATVCTFCKHLYIKPCTDKTKDSCPNYQHLKSRTK